VPKLDHGPCAGFCVGLGFTRGFKLTVQLADRRAEQLHRRVVLDMKIGKRSVIFDAETFRWTTEDKVRSWESEAKKNYPTFRSGSDISEALVPTIISGAHNRSCFQCFA
jgi:hypothetical protein